MQKEGAMRNFPGKGFRPTKQASKVIEFLYFSYATAEKIYTYTYLQSSRFSSLKTTRFLGRYPIVSSLFWAFGYRESNECYPEHRLYRIFFLEATP